jgi:hypothetical protein
MTDNTPISIKEIKLIRDFIEKKISNSQKSQIIDIIKNSNLKYTMNKNGYFINLNNIPDDLLKKIKMFVDFTKDNAKELLKTEEVLNTEKTRIETIDKNTSDISSIFQSLENDGDKNINFEIYSLDSIQNDIFNEYQNENIDEKEFESTFILNEPTDINGYRIILKKYKIKYNGNRAKILKKFREISRLSINNRSIKTSLNNIKQPTRIKLKKGVENVIKNDDTDDEEEKEETEETEEVVEEDE